MDDPLGIALRVIGTVTSTLASTRDAPKQGREGAPEAWLELNADVAQGLTGLEVGERLLVITWLHLADRDVLQVRPRSRPGVRLTGVFGTRSPARPNPLGLHPVVLLGQKGTRLRVGPLEAIDGTPIVDIKSDPGASDDSSSPWYGMPY